MDREFTNLRLLEQHLRQVKATVIKNRVHKSFLLAGKTFGLKVEELARKTSRLQEQKNYSDCSIEQFLRIKRLRLVLGRKSRFIQEVQSVLDEQVSTGHRGKIATKDVGSNSFHFSIKSFEFTNIKV